ncbi:hypothetical protein EZS27_038961 [termite gut metagenome]|uniref:Uncharacterized protein n=1 Tax=termite gut metagenome TaxID=433724 RepID=A0A5J4PJY9_9ZZZZ
MRSSRIHIDLIKHYCIINIVQTFQFEVLFISIKHNRKMLENLFTPRQIEYITSLNNNESKSLKELLILLNRVYIQ